MNDLKRLIDQCDSELGRALLKEGRRVSRDDGRKLRVLAVLGVGAALSTTSKASWALTTTWKKLALGGFAVFSGVGGGALAYHYYEASQNYPAAAVTPTQLSVPQVVEVPVVQAERTETVTDSVVTDSVESGPPSPVNDTARSVKRRAPEVSSSAGSLREEVELLDRARAAARAGRGAEALSLVDAYAKAFPKGTLRLEAEVVRVQALASSGKRAEASALAKRLLARSPNSVVASRLRAYVTE